MPEGPSIIILKEAVQPFEGKKIVAASGYGDIDKKRMNGKKITGLKTWGKHFLICFKGFSLRVHLMLFGSYRINKRKATNPKLSLQFDDGSELNFYASALKYIDGPLDEVYDWKADVMSDKWDAKKAKKKLKEEPDMLACDALMNQQIFSGVGNIIKNEVLFRIYVHPASTVGDLPVKQLNDLIREARNYSFDFLEWKKKGVLSRHWLAYAKKKCPRCKIPLVKQDMGKSKRRTFFCNNCQELYGGKVSGKKGAAVEKKAAVSSKRGAKQRAAVSDDPSAKEKLPVSIKPSTKQKAGLRSKPTGKQKVPVNNKRNTIQKAAVSDNPSAKEKLPVSIKPSTKQKAGLRSKPTGKQEVPVNNKRGAKQKATVKRNPPTKKKLLRKQNPS